MQHNPFAINAHQTNKTELAANQNTSGKVVVQAVAPSKI